MFSEEGHYLRRVEPTPQKHRRLPETLPVSWMMMHIDMHDRRWGYFSWLEKGQSLACGQLGPKWAEDAVCIEGVWFWRARGETSTSKKEPLFHTGPLPMPLGFTPAAYREYLQVRGLEPGKIGPLE